MLDKLATQFSAMENIRIERTNWLLTDATQDSIKRDARKRAAQDAFQRARHYAEVFADVAPEEVKDKVQAVEVKGGPYYQQSTRSKLHYGTIKKHRSTLMAAADLQFEPEDVRLEIKVDGKFAIDV